MTTAFQSNAFQNNAFQVDPVTGVLYVVDQNDSCSMVGLVSGGESTVDTHDGFTREEIRRLERLKKDLAKIEEKREKALVEAKKRRRSLLENKIDPKVAKVKIVEVKSEEFDVIPSIDLEKINAQIAQLEIDRQRLLARIAQIEAKAQFDAYMAKLKADYEQNLEDEEALLLLL